LLQESKQQEVANQGLLVKTRKVFQPSKAEPIERFSLAEEESL
jgi:hypothetical protein